MRCEFSRSGVTHRFLTESDMETDALPTVIECGKEEERDGKEEERDGKEEERDGKEEERDLDFLPEVSSLL